MHYCAVLVVSSTCPVGPLLETTGTVKKITRRVDLLFSESPRERGKWVYTPGHTGMMGERLPGYRGRSAINPNNSDYWLHICRREQVSCARQTHTIYPTYKFPPAVTSSLLNSIYHYIRPRP